MNKFKVKVVNCWGACYRNNWCFNLFRIGYTKEDKYIFYITIFNIGIFCSYEYG